MSKQQGIYEAENPVPGYESQPRIMKLGALEGPIITLPVIRKGEPQVYGEPDGWEYDPDGGSAQYPGGDIANMPSDYQFNPITHSKYFKVDWQGDVEVGDDLKVGEWVNVLSLGTIL